MLRAPLHLILILGALTAFGAISIDLYLPSLPSLEKDLAAPAGSAQYTLAAFVIGLAIGQSLYGPLVDHFGRKRPLYIGVVLYVLASIGCALATSMDALQQIKIDAPNCFVIVSSRAPRLTTGPRTPTFACSGAPILPAIACPCAMPMPTRKPASA